MGTSSSYKGSSGKIPAAMRDGLNDWAESQTAGNHTAIPESVVAQAIRIPVFSRSSGSDGGSGGGGSGASGTGGGSRKGGKQSQPQRSARAYASTAGRAAAIAQAFRDGDREELARHGLDLDKLSKMSSRAEMVRAIVEAISEAQPGSDIPSEEQRQVAGYLVDWMLDTELNQEMPDAAEVAEHAIGLIIAEIVLSEADEMESREGISRDEFIDQVHETSQRVAAKADLKNAGAGADAMTKSIERGIRTVRKIYSPKESS